MLDYVLKAAHHFITGILHLQLLIG